VKKSTRNAALLLSAGLVLSLSGCASVQRWWELFTGRSPKQEEVRSPPAEVPPVPQHPAVQPQEPRMAALAG
jgi:hypothetical protein